SSAGCTRVVSGRPNDLPLQAKSPARVHLSCTYQAPSTPFGGLASSRVRDEETLSLADVACITLNPFGSFTRSFRSGPIMTSTSRTEIICQECDNAFIYTDAEREFRESRGLSPPVLCPDCRGKSRARR